MVASIKRIDARGIMRALLDGSESAMRAYLGWDIDLVNQVANDDDQRFRVAKL